MNLNLEDMISELFSKIDGELENHNDKTISDEEMGDLVEAGTKALFKSLQDFLEPHKGLSVAAFTNIRYSIGINLFVNNILNIMLNIREDYREDEMIKNLMMAAISLKDGSKKLKEIEREENTTLN